MNLNPDSLEPEGYVLLDKLDHLQLIPFVRMYINKRTRFAMLYMLANLLAFGSAGFFLLRYYRAGEYSLGEGLTYFSFGIASVFALLPLHEFIHVLAYKAQGAKKTSYDANLKKFYFLAVADRFVANRREFQIVALSPFVIISSIGLLLLNFTSPHWTMTVLGALLIHTSFCSGDFGLLSYFDFHKDMEVVTYDDKDNRVSYFYGLKKE